MLSGMPEEYCDVIRFACTWDPSEQERKSGKHKQSIGVSDSFVGRTLTMEMQIDSLPGEEHHSILQCNHNQDVIQSTVETELYGIGALSTFSEVPKDVFFKPGKWNQIRTYHSPTGSGVRSLVGPKGPN